MHGCYGFLYLHLILQDDFKIFTSSIRDGMEMQIQVYAVVEDNVFPVASNQNTTPQSLSRSSSNFICISGHVQNKSVALISSAEP